MITRPGLTHIWDCLFSYYSCPRLRGSGWIAENLIVNVHIKTNIVRNNYCLFIIQKSRFIDKSAISSIAEALSFSVSITFVRTGRTLAKMKNVKMAFVDFDICHRMVSLRNLFYFLMSTILNVNISETVRDSLAQK